MYNVFYLLFLLLMVCSCNPSIEAAEEVRLDSLLKKATAEGAGKQPQDQLRSIDSATQKLNMPLELQLRVLDYKYQVYLNDVKDTIAAAKLADSMLKLVETDDANRHRRAFAKANYYKGDYHFFRKEYNQAYSFYFRARQAGTDALDSCTLGEYSFRLALIKYRQERFGEAARSFVQAFDEAGNCTFLFDNYYRMQQVLNNAGLSYFKAGMPDSALHYFNKCLWYISKYEGRFPQRVLHHRIARAVVLGNLADIYVQRGEWATARELLTQSIGINSEKGADIKDAHYSMIKLAELYLKGQQYDSMYHVLQRTGKSIDTVKNLRAEMDWNRLMWNYYNKAGRTEPAYDHLKRYISLRDELELQTSQVKTVDLSQQMKTMEDSYQIETLKKDNELKNVYLLIVVLSFLLAASIVFFTYRSLKRTRSNMTQLKVLHAQLGEQKEVLELALTELDKKNEQQKRIMGMVAHDLRSPVASINMLADLLMDDDMGQEAKKELVQMVKNSCQQSLGLIEEILESTRLENSKELNKQSTSVNSLVMDTVALLRLKATEKQQSITVSLPRKDIVVKLNKEKMQRVFSNLINNAIKFSHKGAAIGVKLTATDNEVLVETSDEGVGIPEHMKHKVFDMFTEAKRVGTAGESTYGLGLSICRQVVEAHHGKIWFESKEGAGTSFFVSIPVDGAQHN